MEVDEELRTELTDRQFRNMKKEFVPKIVNWYENGAWVPHSKFIRRVRTSTQLGPTSIRKAHVGPFVANECRCFVAAERQRQAAPVLGN